LVEKLLSKLEISAVSCSEEGSRRGMHKFSGGAGKKRGPRPVLPPEPALLNRSLAIPVPGEDVYDLVLLGLKEEGREGLRRARRGNSSPAAAGLRPVKRQRKKGGDARDLRNALNPETVDGEQLGGRL